MVPMEIPIIARSKPKVLIVNVPRHFIGSHYGMGYQVPLGLVSIGGPLVDAGYDVKFVDADAYGYDDRRIMKEIYDYGAGIILVGHNGSTAAYPSVVKFCQAVKQEFPELKLVYGGVFPTFGYRAILEQVPEIDVIVRGEGEQTVVDVVSAIVERESLSKVDGIVWQENGHIEVNKNRMPIENLDNYRLGWELVDWDLYSLFGLRPSGQIQFGRGCIYKCSYCGQWSFWKTYRHRSPRNFVDNLQLLKEKYGVRAVCPADEHFAADRQTTEELLSELISRNLDIPLYINLTVKDILRDSDILPLYRKAGIVFAAIGVESDSENVQQKINKYNALEESCQAVKLLRKNKIMPLIQMIYGLEDESLKTVWRKFSSIKKIDPDFANLEYITPHFWTPLGKTTDPSTVIQLDQSKWGYRNQVIKAPLMSEKSLFWSVKITEMLIHLRPKVLIRALLQSHKYIQNFRIMGLWGAFKVWLMEIAEFYKDTVFSKPGAIYKEPAFLQRVLNKKPVKQVQKGS